MNKKTDNSNMERPISVLQQRPISFNPQAATFSPISSSPIPQSIDDHPPTSTIAQMAPMFDCSPFQGAGGMHSLYRRDPLTPISVRLEDFLSPDMQALVKKLEEHPDVQEIHAPCTPTQRTTRPARYDAGPPNYLPPFKFPPQQVRPDHGAVGINELSVGLGLPSLKADTNEDGSPAASQHSRLSQAHPGALYGKLIGWALDKPLTAKGLAGYLQNQNLHTPSNRLEPMTHASSANTVLEDTEAILTPPRSAQTRAPIHVTAEAVNEPQGQSAFQHQHRRSSNSSASYRHHTRNSSTRKFSRRMSRAKRMDQGPMPSSADIYPDDANWTPSAPIYEGQNYLAYHGQPVEQPKVVVDNAFNWPTPAQVYRPELAPTAADIGAADRDVLAIMSESTGLSLNTLAELSTSQDLSVAAGLNLPWDLRALTPAQLDGSRYGMKFYGIAIGDEWDLDLVGDFDQSKPFRVRPREHDGWGGWEWARSRGWGA